MHMTATVASARSPLPFPAPMTPRGAVSTPADAGLAEFDAASRLRVVDAGETLFEQGEEFSGLFRVVSGLIGIRIIDESGNLSLLSLAGPGNVVGYCPLLIGGGHATSAVVLQTSRIEVVDAATSRTLVRESPAALSALLQQSARDLAALQQKHVRMLTQEAPARLAGLLLSLAGDAGRGDGGCRFALPVSRQDVADFIGIRAETLSRALRQLKLQGVAQVNGREVVVPSLARLRQVAEPDADDFACAV